MATGRKAKKKPKATKRGPKPKGIEHIATLSQAIAEIDADIKVLNDKKKKLQELLK